MAASSFPPALRRRRHDGCQYRGGGGGGGGRREAELLAELDKAEERRHRHEQRESEIKRIEQLYTRWRRNAPP